jgi:hypothetical protein
MKKELDVENRPESFNERIMQYMPGLNSAARRWYPGQSEKASELVVDTIVYALENWRGYREEADAFHSWLMWRMRDCVTKKRRGEFRHSQTFVDSGLLQVPHSGEERGDHVENLSDRFDGGCQPSQEDYVALKQTIEKINKERYGHDLLKEAAGYSLSELTENKVSKQAVQQRIAATRKRLGASPYA